MILLDTVQRHQINLKYLFKVYLTEKVTQNLKSCNDHL